MVLSPTVIFFTTTAICTSGRVLLGPPSNIGKKGFSVIDYVIGNDEASKEIKMVQGNRTESDHIPLEIELTGSQIIERKNGKETEAERND